MINVIGKNGIINCPDKNRKNVYIPKDSFGYMLTSRICERCENLDSVIMIKEGIVVIRCKYK